MPVQINGTTGITTNKIAFGDYTFFDTNNAILKPSQASLNQVLTYNGTAWVASPISFGGDVSGSLPSPLVTKIQGIPVSNIPPQPGQVLTYNGSTNTWVPSAAPAPFTGFGSEYFTGILLPAGENKTFTVPSGVKRIEITAVGSGGNGGDVTGTTVIATAGVIRSVNLMIGSVCVPYQTITDTRFTISDSYKTNISGANRGGGSGGVAWTKTVGYAPGGGSGGWVKKTLDVRAGDRFIYTTGIPNRESSIIRNAWTMIGNAGQNPGTRSPWPPGVGGTIAGDYDVGYVGEPGIGGGAAEGLGGRQRGLDGNFDSMFSGYIFIRIAP